MTPGFEVDERDEIRPQRRMSLRGLKIVEEAFEPPSRRLRSLVFLIVLVLTVGLCTLLLIPQHVDPISAYSALLNGAFGTRLSWGYALANAAPLILVGLATAVAWRSGFFYAGFDGSIIIGGLCVAVVAQAAGPGGLFAALPRPLFFALALLVGFGGGALWALTPAILKVRYGGNELIVSLMLNYVAAYLVQYLVSQPLRAPGTSTPETNLFPAKTWLPDLLSGTTAHVGIVIAVCAAVAYSFVWRKTVLGYEFRVVGLNLKAAAFAGIDGRRQTITAAIFAGGMCGLAGLCDVLGVQHLLQDGFETNQGFLGAAVGLLGGLTATGTVIAGILFGGLNAGSSLMQIETGIPGSVVVIFEYMLILGVLTIPGVARFRVRKTATAPNSEPASTPEPIPIGVGEHKEGL
jgi:simple sugar transport system permease protein